jgi:mannosyl-oligosaccharide alpha-1,2-mannosidase
VILCVLVLFTLLLCTGCLDQSRRLSSPIDRLTKPGFFHAAFKWKNIPTRHPVTNLTQLPAGPNVDIPKVQFDFGPESAQDKEERQHRLAEVKKAFLHSWEGYKKNAWLQDEVAPITGGSKTGFGGWGATLVDSLDTLVIMGLDEEFKTAVKALKHVHFRTADLTTLNVFETTIRYLGGLLSAYDISGHKYPVLLDRAIDLGEMLYVAFDTPNRRYKI